MTRVRVSAEASEELEQAAAWYEEQSPGLGANLVDAFEHAIDLLREESPPLVTMGGQSGRRGAKRLLLHRFPFSVVTIEVGDERVVIALAHHARRPDYWRDRLPT